MKRILTILLTLLTISLFGQDIKPISPNFKPLQSPSFSYYTNDSTVWIYKGSALGWTKLFGAKTVQHKIDSLAIHGASTVINSYVGKKQVTTTNNNVYWTIPFGHTKYFLSIYAYYNRLIDGKNVQVQNAIYDFSKTSGGITFKVDTVAGYFEYFAADTTNLYPMNPSGNIDIFNEIPTGDINGSNNNFELSVSPLAGYSRVYLNGIRQFENIDYTVSGSIIHFTDAPLNNDIIRVDYRTYEGSLVQSEFFNVTPSGDIDGVNDHFSIPNNPDPDATRVYLNGVKQILLIDFNVSGNLIIFNSPPQIGDFIRIDYKL